STFPANQRSAVCGHGQPTWGFFDNLLSFLGNALLLFDRGQSPEITEMDLPPETGRGRYDSA
ncbi:MAG: hypothetical protein PUJ39_06545, partial [Eubacteriales bacterium]|nr:hypothetical protein [Eubacteriales bacterium]